MPRKRTTDDPEAEFRSVHADLVAAIAALIDTTYTRMADGTTAAVHARLESLADSVAGQQGNGGRLAARSLPPLWLPAASLLDEIATAVGLWPWGKGGSTTAERLARVSDYPFGPSDAPALTQIVRILKSWADDIDALLDPESVKTVSAPCPRCGATHVYRQDGGGETVRRPALQLTSAACVCLACHAQWLPGQFQLLARVLDCPAPAGVVA